MSVGEIIQGWLGTAFQAVTAVGVLFGIGQTIRTRRDAVSAAKAAQEAAAIASGHAEAAKKEIEINTALTRQIEVQGNSIQLELLRVTREAATLAGEKTGRENEIARRGGDDVGNPRSET